MSNNPQCSWAKTYNQMWNLSMRTPIGVSYGKNYLHMADDSNPSKSAPT